MAVFFKAPQTSAIALILPLVTLFTHVVVFFFLRVLYTGTWSSLILAWYDVVAAAASVFGFVGVVKERHILVSLYMSIHAITLSTITLVLSINTLPFWLTRKLPALSYFQYDQILEFSMCSELDDGFGWDASWYDQCRSSSRALATGIVWVGLMLVAAHWWALFCLRIWNMDLKGWSSMRKDDMEKQSIRSPEFMDKP